MSTNLYDPTELAGNMHLTEAEIRLAILMDNDLCTFEEDYNSIKQGDTLVLTGEEVEDALGPIGCRLRLNGVEGGVTFVDDWEVGTLGIGEVGDSFRDRPHCKMFEATVLSSDNYDREPGEEVFGLLFPDGHAIVVDSGPEEDFTNRRILASIAMLDAERKGTHGVSSDD